MLHMPTWRRAIEPLASVPAGLAARCACERLRSTVAADRSELGIMSRTQGAASIVACLVTCTRHARVRLGLLARACRSEPRNFRLSVAFA